MGKGWFQKTIDDAMHAAREGAKPQQAPVSNAATVASMVDVPEQTATPFALPWVSGMFGGGSVLDAFAKDSPPEKGWKNGRYGLDRKSWSGEAGSRTATVASVHKGRGVTSLSASRAKEGPDGETHTGAGVLLGGSDKSAVGIGRRRVTERDATGAVKSGHQASATIGAGGVGAKLGGTRNGATTAMNGGMDFDGNITAGTTHSRGGKTAGASVTATDDGLEGKVSYGKTGGANGSLSGSIGDGAWSLGATAGGKYAKVGFNLAVMDDKEIAGHSAANTSVVSQLLGGDTVGYGLMDGQALSGSLAVSNGWLGAGVNGGVSEHASLHAHTTVDNLLKDLKNDPAALQKASMVMTSVGPRQVDLSNLDGDKLRSLAKSEPQVYRKLLASQLGKRVKGKEGLADLDLGEMRSGDAFTQVHGEGWSAGGSVTVGVTASLGVENQEAEQVTIAKTADDTYKVQLTAQDSDSLKAGLGLAGVASLGVLDTETGTTELSFEVKGPKGLEALADFQKTGILPGARDVVKDKEAFSSIAALRQKIALLGDPAELDPFSASRATLLRDELTAKIGRVNHQMLKGSLDLTTLSKGLPGVEYTTRRMTQSDSDKSSVSLLGLDALSWEWGSTHTWWDEQYRQEGSDQWARGTKHDEDNVWSADETTSMVLNPKNAMLKDAKGNGAEIELAMFSDQSLNKRQRALLDKVGGTRGMLPAMRDAWVAGGWKDDAPTSQLRLGWTAQHLDILRGATSGNAAFWAGAGSSVGSFLDKGADAQGFQGTSPFQSQTKVMEHWDNQAYDDAAGSVFKDVAKEWGIPLEYGHPGFGGTELSEATRAQLSLKATELGQVKTAEAFDALSENEQTLLLTSTALENIAHDKDPWSAVVMAMQVKDNDLRNRHLRKLFHVIEKRKPDTHAMVDFVAHLDAASYLKDGERKALLGSLEVHAKDKRVDRRAKDIAGWQSAWGIDRASYVASQILDDSSDLRSDQGRKDLFGRDATQDWMYQEQQRHRADDTVDWVQAAWRAGGAKLLDEVLRKGRKDNPQFLVSIYNRTQEVDPRRAAILMDMMKQTPTFQRDLQALKDGFGFGGE